MSGTLERLLLTLDPGTADAREYEITMIDTVDVSSTKEAFSISPPGLSARENILLGISGMQADLSVNFAAHDDGTDKARGTHTSTVVTVEEQLRYLEDVMHAPDFSASWQLDHLTGAAFDADSVFVENVEVTPISQQSPKWRPTRLRLRRGSSVG